MLDVAIIGGGLSGLSLAHGLLETGRTFTVFESRERFGGRIFSVPPVRLTEDGWDNARFDLGPSWVWPDFQPRLARFLQHNDITIFSQWTNGKSLYHADRLSAPHAYMDESTYESAWRIGGGSWCLIEKLLEKLPQTRLESQHHLQRVIDRQDYVELHFSVNGKDMVVGTRQVVITIPPRLLINSVSFTPPVDARLHAVMAGTPTWMAGQAKAVICYERPFWREAGFSGNAMTVYPGAALGEIFDASLPAGECPALSGFFALPAGFRSRFRNDLEGLILEQLVRLFGKDAARPEEMIVKDWFDDPLTAAAADEFPPVTHPRYGHAWLQLDHWDEKLYFSGTETAVEFGGYLEGALESSERVLKSLLV